MKFDHHQTAHAVDAISWRVVQSGSGLPLSIARDFIQEYVTRQQAKARANEQRIEELQRETDALAAEVARKRSEPLVRPGGSFLAQAEGPC